MKRYILALLFIAVCTIAYASLSEYQKVFRDISVSPILYPYDSINNYPDKARWDNLFKGKYGSEWQILIDVRGNTPGSVFGQGLPIIPGYGNDFPILHEYSDEDLAALVIDFISQNATLFNISTEELVFSQAVYTDNKWFVNFRREYKGVEVMGSSFITTISHGNLISFGAIKWGEIIMSISPSLTTLDIKNDLLEYLNETEDYLAYISEPELVIIPTPKNGSTKEAFTGNIGDGYQYRLVSSISVVDFDNMQYTALLDSNTGEVLSFVSEANTLHQNGHVSGGIYAYEQAGEAPSFYNLGIPFADLRIAHECYTNGPDSCETDTPKDFLAAYPNYEPDALTNTSGNYTFDTPPPEGFQTRLVGPYAYIIQSFYKDDYQCTSSCSYSCYQQSSSSPEDVYICAPKYLDSNYDGINIDLDGNESPFPSDDESCHWNESSMVTCGTNVAAITAFYHANKFKELWRNKLGWYVRQHVRPFETPRLRGWLTSKSGRTKIFVNQTCPHGGAEAFAPNNSVCFQKGMQGNQYYEYNTAENPSILFHEFGHLVDQYDHSENFSNSIGHSSEGFADIVSALNANDSCIGRGSSRYPQKVWKKRKAACILRFENKPSPRGQKGGHTPWVSKAQRSSLRQGLSGRRWRHLPEAESRYSYKSC